MESIVEKIKQRQWVEGCCNSIEVGGGMLTEKVTLNIGSFSSIKKAKYLRSLSKDNTIDMLWQTEEISVGAIQGGKTLSSATQSVNWLYISPCYLAICYCPFKHER